MRRLAIVMSGLAALAGCTANGTEMGPAGSAAPQSVGASAAIRNVAGETKAQATATQVGDSVRIRVEAIGMPRGSYGAHIHTTGRCDGPDFGSAGPHWNPTAMKHGKNNPQGMHKGDLPNLLVGSDGRGTLEINIVGASLRSGPMPLLDADGAAIVLHAQADDYRTDPSGNSGARIACGVLG